MILFFGLVLGFFLNSWLLVTLFIILWGINEWNKLKEDQ